MTDDRHQYQQFEVKENKRTGEKILILDLLDMEAHDRDWGLGPKYLVRGDDNKKFNLHEREIVPIGTHEKLKYA
jgi:hypothetical protein